MGDHKSVNHSAMKLNFQATLKTKQWKFNFPDIKTKAWKKFTWMFEVKLDQPPLFG